MITADEARAITTSSKEKREAEFKANKLPKILAKLDAKIRKAAEYHLYYRYKPRFFTHSDEEFEIIKDALYKLGYKYTTLYTMSGYIIGIRIDWF